MNPITKIIGTTLPLNAHWNIICGNNTVVDNKAEWQQAAYSQSGIIAEEVKELAEAVAAIEAASSHEGMAERHIAARDAIADAIVTIDGAVHRLDLLLDLFADDGLLQTDYARFNSVLNTGNTPKSVLDALDTLAALECDKQDVEAAVSAVRVLYNYIFTMAEVYNINVENDVMNVYLSNMSKYTTQRKIAEAGAKRLTDFASKINNVTVGGKEYFSVCSAKEQKVGSKTYPLNKVLKPHFYVEPVLAPALIWSPFSYQIAARDFADNINRDEAIVAGDWYTEEFTPNAKSGDVTFDIASYVFDVFKGESAEERIKRVDDILEVAGGLKPHGSARMLTVGRLIGFDDNKYFVFVLENGVVRSITIIMNGDEEPTSDQLARAILYGIDAVSTPSTRRIVYTVTKEEAELAAKDLTAADVDGDTVAEIEEDDSED